MKKPATMGELSSLAIAARIRDNELDHNSVVDLPEGSYRAFKLPKQVYKARRRTWER